MTQRIQATAEAATFLFLRQGYSKTQISHIAKAVGVSVGTIYHDFVGKREIMHYILKCIVQPSFSEQEIETPISDGNFEGLEQEIAGLFETAAMEFKGPLQNDLNDYSFEAFISDAFDLLSRYAKGCLFIEKNQYDFPFLAKHYREYRKEFLSTVKEYLKAFIEKGIVRELEDLDLTTVFIVEALSWWAMDIRYTSFEISDIPPETAKKVCMDNLIPAYKNN